VVRLNIGILETLKIFTFKKYIKELLYKIKNMCDFFILTKPIDLPIDSENKNQIIWLIDKV
jgi:hypothetical protein